MCARLIVHPSLIYATSVVLPVVCSPLARPIYYSASRVADSMTASVADVKKNDEIHLLGLELDIIHYNLVGFAFRWRPSTNLALVDSRTQFCERAIES